MPTSAAADTIPQRASCSRLGLCLGLRLLFSGVVCSSSLGLLASCQPNQEDISRWKGTEKGPGKLRDVLHSNESEDLRVQAGLALIEIRRGEEVDAELRAFPESTRRSLVHRMIPLLVDVLHKGAPDATPTRAQIEAKDALFRLRTLGSPDDRNLADDTLVAWTTADLIGRMSAGSFSSEHVITQIGSRAQGALLALLSRATIDAPNLMPAASLLGRIGDRQAKGHGAELLIKLLQPVLGGGTNKEMPSQRLIDGVLRALGTLGGPAAGKFLADLSERGPTNQRGQALAALRETADPTALELGLRIAWDKKEPNSVREAAFSYLEKVGQIAVEGLCKIIADPRDPSEKGETVRFRAFEAALAAGGVLALTPSMDALPSQRGYPREDITAFVVRQMTHLGAPARPQIRKLLTHKSWVARSAALLTLAELPGTAADPVVKEDLEAMGALTTDLTPLVGKGWQVVSVGELAKIESQRLRSKR